MIKNIVLVLLIISVVFFITFPFINNIFVKTNYKSIISKRISNISKSLDANYLHDIIIENGFDNTIRIDNILITSKFIYIINSLYFCGKLIGQSSNNSWNYINLKDKEVSYTDNLFIMGEHNINSLAKSLNVDSNLITQIFVINNNVEVDLDSLKKNNIILTKMFKIKQTIKKVEQEKVTPLSKNNIELIFNSIKTKNEETEKRKINKQISI